MGLCKILVLTFLIGIVSFVWLTFVKKHNVTLPAEAFADRYWGPRALKANEPIPKDDVTIKPFKVVYDEAVVKDLHARLDRAKYVKPLLNSFENGFNGDYLKKVVQHWRQNFDWKKQVDFINSFPQFKTQIEGLNVHFVHIKPLGTAKVVKPIVLVNGWPSNFHQLYKLADLLRKPVNGVAFEVVLPSRPGYGFSDAPNHANFSIADSARIYTKLMKRLGHNRFYFHGEDWGAIETHAISAMYPDHIEGAHMGMGMADLDLKTVIKLAFGAYFPSLVYENEYEAQQFATPGKFFGNTLREMGYFMLQTTKPDTIGASLIDSPVGLAAYVLEKYSTWVNPEFRHLPDGGLTKSLTLDELLTNIMVFWVTENGAYSTRYYKEFGNHAFGGPYDISKTAVSPKVPFGFAVGEHELDLGKMKPYSKYNVVKFDLIKNTGHFSSFENPTEVANHIRQFVSIVLKQNQKPQKSEL